MKKKTLAALAATVIALPAAILPLTNAFAADSNTASLAADMTVNDVVLKWNFNNFSNAWSMDAGRTTLYNYMSAGKSDGTEGTYHQEYGNVSVYFADGSTPTYATRNNYATNSTPGQYFTLSGGTADIKKDGSGTVTWTDDAVSVVYYGGMVPLWFENFKLTVNADRTAQLTGTIGGKTTGRGATTQTDLPTQDNVVFADFESVTLGQNGEIVATPKWSQVEAPANNSGNNVAAQNKEATNWGSWPASFVEYQYKTALSSYFYSSKNDESDNELKRPQAVTFTFPEAEAVPTVTTTEVTTQVSTEVSTEVSTSVSTEVSTSVSTTTVAAEPVTSTATATTTVAGAAVTTTATSTATETVTAEPEAPATTVRSGFSGAALTFWDSLIQFIKGGAHSFLSFWAMIFYPVIQLFK
ncbi:MAG: hypothetical protein Q3972_06010 [Corynebacterium sp.]|nr:hypothetical protein [Corynebacterium sp.]